MELHIENPKADFLVDNKKGRILRCQFCDYVGKGWTNKGMTCPKCKRDYDWLLAQDSEE